MAKTEGRTWSPQQKKIFSWGRTGKGNLVVRARAGTGKTTTILEMVEKHCPEQRILLAAFNKTIATELQSRIKSPYVQAKTLHGLGFSFVRSMWGNVQVDTDGNREIDLAQKVCDPNDPHEAVRLVARIHTKVRELQPHLSGPNDILDLMTDLDLMPEESLELEEGITARWIAEHASKAVDLAKLRTSLIDFADMIFLPLVHGAVKQWYDLVVVDEAQDMSEPQLEMAISACSTNGRIAVVGDDRQAIYGFRGADSGSIERETKRARSALKENAAENRIAYVHDIVGVVSALSEDVATVAELRSKLNTLFVQEPGNSIICSSTHKAKGLESKNVFLLSGTFLGKRSGETEERNLLYVAVTRSMHRLVWVSGFEK